MLECAVSSALHLKTNSVMVYKVYKNVEIIDGVLCEDSLDAVKCLPEFYGSKEKYVAIKFIRSKVRRPANAILA